MTVRLLIVTTFGLLAFAHTAQSGDVWHPSRCANGPLWANDFDAIDIGGEPDDTLVLEGEFTVQADGDDNRALHLPGAPLGTYGMLLGPSERADVSIAARIRSERKGRRYPAFGVGLGGNSGYRMQVTPGRDALELMLNGSVVKRVNYTWKSGAWTRVRMEVRPAGEDRWVVRGKAWSDGGDEPAWQLEYETEKKPRNGGASVWGLPYSGEPIWFDDVVYSKVGGE